jgi:hypothetical protein
MEVVDYFAHPGERKVIGINGEYPSLVHVVCKKLIAINKGNPTTLWDLSKPMSVHMVSRGMPADA